jgi:hypothetical protein
MYPWSAEKVSREQPLSSSRFPKQGKEARTGARRSNEKRRNVLSETPGTFHSSRVFDDGEPPSCAVPRYLK